VALVKALKCSGVREVRVRAPGRPNDDGSEVREVGVRNGFRVEPVDEDGVDTCGEKAATIVGGDVEAAVVEIAAGA
jgi:hypothetical protein